MITIIKVICVSNTCAYKKKRKNQRKKEKRREHYLLK